MHVTPMHVTVVIPTRNRGALLAGGVEAALAQTHRDLDVLVIDDASTDGTAERLASFRTDPRVAWVRLARPSGSAAAKNLGLLLARGAAVCFHACDDLPARDKVAAQLAALARRAVSPGAGSRIAAALTGHVVISRDGVEEVVQDPDCAGGGRPPIDAGLFRREVFARLGGFSTGVDEDRDMQRRIQAAGGVLEVVARPLLTRFERPSLRSVAGACHASGAPRDAGRAGRATARREPVQLATLSVAAFHSRLPLRIDPAVPVSGSHPSLARFGLVQKPAPAAMGA